MFAPGSFDELAHATAEIKALGFSLGCQQTELSLLARPVAQANRGLHPDEGNGFVGKTPGLDQLQCIRHVRVDDPHEKGAVIGGGELKPPQLLQRHRLIVALGVFLLAL